MIPHDINPFNTSKMLFISSDIAHDARRFHFVMIMTEEWCLFVMNERPKIILLTCELVANNEPKNFSWCVALLPSPHYLIQSSKEYEAYSAQYQIESHVMINGYNFHSFEDSTFYIWYMECILMRFNCCTIWPCSNEINVKYNKTHILCYLNKSCNMHIVRICVTKVWLTILSRWHISHIFWITKKLSNRFVIIFMTIYCNYVQS